MEQVKQNSRSLILDAVRGFTVVLMIIFHFSFDLTLFGFAHFDIIREPFWYAFPRLIVFLFLFSVGVALTLAHQNSIKWTPFFKRLALISFWAVIISLATYYMYPENWIYFGTLHAIAVVSVMSLPFLKHPHIALAVALALFIPSIAFDRTIPWFEMAHSSWDYISPFPWLGSSLIGIFAAHKGFHRIHIKENGLVKSLNYLGKHSLFIYLIHQPILFGILTLVVKLKRA
jgi:uncharacterized membrane protein